MASGLAENIAIEGGETFERAHSSLCRAWIVLNRAGFRRDESGRYHIITNKWGLGRRPLQRHHPWTTWVRGERGIFGQYPVPPAVIVCPRCNTPNDIAPPVE